MEYNEFVRHINKAGLSIKDFAGLIKVQPKTITNLSKKNEIPKHLIIIAVLLGEIVDKGLDYKYLFEKMNLSYQKYEKIESINKIF